ncbi:MAG: FUN14 domain-containing protein [Thermoproteota archaeon]|nr:FUN14 domain-containing protein [Thermoproteota archaeon]
MAILYQLKSSQKNETYIKASTRVLSRLRKILDFSVDIKYKNNGCGKLHSYIGATIGGGFFSGVLIGFALKKVVRLVAVVVGLFLAGLAYLHYQEIININWTRLQAASQNTIATLANATTQIPGFKNSDHIAAISNLGIPLTGSMAMGFTLGFLKG